MGASLILAYHSQNISGNAYHENDHVALAHDLRMIHQQGYSIIALDTLVERLRQGQTPENSVCLTFDDGTDFDALDMNHVGNGMQRSFLNILRDFQQESGQPVSATSFVIASPDARQIIDSKSLYGDGRLSDHWWRSVDREGLIRIESHGWDHNHPDLGGPHSGGFSAVDSYDQCHHQVISAADYIESKTGRRPRFFAYPYGESSAYIREDYFPNHQQEHGCLAAVGTDGGYLNADSDLWNLPRFVCGYNWRSKEELAQILSRSQ